MSFDSLANELIIYLSHFLPSPSLNSLIQTHQRCAILLTPHLYNPEIRLKIKKVLFQEEYEYIDPEHVRLRCLDCAPRWKSNLILEYFRAQPKEIFTLVDGHKCTLLHHIAAKGNTQILEILLSKSSDIEARSLADETPLLIAARQKNKPILKGLLKAGADPRARCCTNITVLVQAIFTKSLPIVQCLITALETRSDDIWAPCTSGEVLHRAIYTGSEPMVRLLLDHGADFLAADEYGTTCLNGAIIWGCRDIVDLLLDRGANVLTNDSLGRTVLTEIGDQLGSTTVQRIVRTFVDAGGDVSTAVGNMPLLHLHAGRGNLHCIETLIDNGADVFSTMINGATPLMCAFLNYNRNSEGNYEGICRALIKAMASPEEDIFAINSMTQMVEWEPQRKVLGMTALHLSAEVGAECLVLLLIEAGASVLIVDDYRRTPLLCALLNGNESVCLILAEEMKVRGYNFATRVPGIPGKDNQTFETLLELATARKMDRLVRFLVHNEAEICRA